MSRYGEYFDLTDPNVITRFLKSGKGRQKERYRELTASSVRTQPSVAGFENGGRD